MVIFASGIQVTGSPQAQVTSGTATVGTGGVSNGGAVTMTGNTVTIPLTNVANAQTINVQLNGVNNTSPGDAPTAAVIIPMSVLIGDTTGEGSVNAADIGQTKSQSGQALTNSNFREDLNVDGSINAADVSLAKSRSGTALP